MPEFLHRTLITELDHTQENQGASSLYPRIRFRFDRYRRRRLQ
jgi:hypothetical protein